MAEDSPHDIDIQRRRAVHALHARRFPASLTRGAYATTFIAVRPAVGGPVPCRVDLRRHGIEGGQGVFVAQGPETPDAGTVGASGIPHARWERLDRASVLRLFGLAGLVHGDLVEDLGGALVRAWAAEGLGADLDGDELALAARSWEAERLAVAGLADLRSRLPAGFAKAAGFLLPAGMAGTGVGVFGDYAIDMLVRDGTLCDLVAALGGLAPLAMARWDVLGRSPFGSPVEFAHGALRQVHMDGGQAITLDEVGWLLHTFGDVASTNVTEDIARALVSYRRAMGFRDLGQGDGAALNLVLAFAGLAETDSAIRKVLGLMGDLGEPDGMPLAFLSGVKRQRDATAETTEGIATKLATDALDLADAIWNAIGSQVALDVARALAPGVIPMLLWDLRDPAVKAFMDGVDRIATAATCRGKGSEGLLAATDPWVRAGRPGLEAGKPGGLGRRRSFREIELAKGKAPAEREAVLGFLADSIGFDLRPQLQALAEEVARMGGGTHERWRLQDYPVAHGPGEAAPSVPDEAATAREGHAPEGPAASAPSAREAGAIPPADEADAGLPTGPGTWWKRASALGQALATRRDES